MVLRENNDFMGKLPEAEVQSQWQRTRNSTNRELPLKWRALSGDPIPNDRIPASD
jgi:hypothetical protein